MPALHLKARTFTSQKKKKKKKKKMPTYSSYCYSHEKQIIAVICTGPILYTWLSYNYGKKNVKEMPKMLANKVLSSPANGVFVLSAYIWDGVCDAWETMLRGGGGGECNRWNCFSSQSNRLTNSSWCLPWVFSYFCWFRRQKLFLPVGNLSLYRHKCKRSGKRSTASHLVRDRSHDPIAL